jgi:hypothetical protein
LLTVISLSSDWMRSMAASALAPLAQPDLEEAHLALLLRDTLGVFQRHDAARLLHPLAGLVDADDAVRDAVDAQRVIDALA